MGVKNKSGIRSRVNQRGVIELWIGEPEHPEADCIAQFDSSYLNDVMGVLANIHKSPKYIGGKHFGVRNHG